MRRVVVTGLGIISSIGTSCTEVLTALRSGRSGLVHWPPMAELGFHCQVYAPVLGWVPRRIGRRALQTMSAAAQYAFEAALDAVEDAGLTVDDIKNDGTAVIVGSAFGGLHEATQAEQVIYTRHNPSRAGGTGPVKMMNSTASGNIATYIGTRGRAYSVSSGIAAGVDSIGHAYELIGHGLQEVALCGASEEACWQNAAASLDALRALPTDYNDQPPLACRPYDRDRQGLVLSEGAGMLVLESWEGAARRGARPYAEVASYGSANDGTDMFRPTGDGLRLALQAALAGATERGVERIDYVNSHAAGSVVGDQVEARTLAEVLGDGPWVSTTKGQVGHSMGAAGAQEAVMTLLMLREQLLVPTANLTHVDADCAGIRHVDAVREVPLETALSFSVGLGGSNAAVIFRRLPEIWR